MDHNQNQGSTGSNDDLRQDEERMDRAAQSGIGDAFGAGNTGTMRDDAEQAFNEVGGIGGTTGGMSSGSMGGGSGSGGGSMGGSMGGTRASDGGIDSGGSMSSGGAVGGSQSMTGGMSSGGSMGGGSMGGSMGSGSSLDSDMSSIGSASSGGTAMENAGSTSTGMRTGPGQTNTDSNVMGDDEDSTLRRG